MHMPFSCVPKVRTVGAGAAIDSALIFGLDAHLWRSSQLVAPVGALPWRKGVGGMRGVGWVV